MWTTAFLLTAMTMAPLNITTDTPSDAPVPQDGWVSLFNGRTLDGWTPKIAGHALGEDPYGTVRVEDGMIRVSYDGYDGPFNGRFMHLFYEAPFDEYDLLVEYRFTGEQAAGGPGWAWRNSGAMLHCQNPTSMGVDQPFPVSIEGQFLGGNGTNARTTMNLCTPGTHVVMKDALDKRHCINSTSQTYHGDQWVTVVFKVRNGHVEHYADGDLVLEYDDPQYDTNDPDAAKLIANDTVALNSGWISLQGESHPIDFKRVWIRPGSDSVAGASPAAAETDPRWLVYEGDVETAPGNGRRIVFISGDEEYRSEEGLPMLARGFAKHGFETVVLFSQSPETGEIDPEEPAVIAGMHLVDDADVLVLQLRFREFADADMKHIMDYVNAGKPLTALRTTTHPFFYRKDTDGPFAQWSWNAPGGGFGKRIVGETWVNHHGHHGREATRGIVHEANKDHPVLRGVSDVFGPTDVYGIQSLPDDAIVMLDGGILQGMNPKDELVDDDRNNPMHPVAWLRERPMSNDTVQRIVVTTMGTAQDLSSADLRTYLLNGVLWQLGAADAIPEDGLDMEIVGAWDPSPFGFGTHRKGFSPSDIANGYPLQSAGKHKKQSD